YAARISRTAGSRAAAAMSKRALSGLTRSVRPTLPKTQVAGVRGIKKINFGGVEEIVHERADWPREKLL
ncbi:hypothetical protein WICPIJ_009349, partial [Wickerhamomyces pijperi]